MRHYIVLYVTGPLAEQKVKYVTHRYFQVGEFGRSPEGRFRVIELIK